MLYQAGYSYPEYIIKKTISIPPQGFVFTNRRFGVFISSHLQIITVEPYPAYQLTAKSDN